ncbi:MAG: tetratricopeptide repeat protein [Fusobacteriota bacterium]
MKDFVLLIILSLVIINITYGASVDYNNFYNTYRPNQYNSEDKKTTDEKARDKKARDEKNEISKNEIKIKNKIKVDDTLNLYLDESSTKYKWELISRPRFSELSIKSKSSNVSMKPDVAGKYRITVEVNGEKLIKDILVYKNTSLSKEELMENIEESIDSGDLKKFNNFLSTLKKNYPKEIKLDEYYQKAINLAKEKDQVEIELKYIKATLNEFKLTSKMKEKYTSRYLEIIAKKELSRKEIMKKLNFIREKERYKYNKEIAKIFLQSGYINKALDILEMEYSKTGDKNLISTLQELYIKINRLDKAIYYTKLLEDNEKLAEIYFDIGDKESLEKLKDNFNKEQISNLEKYIDTQKSKAEEEKYYENGLKSLNNYRFDMAKLYYLKILENSENDNLIKKTLKDLAKLHFLNQEYQKSLEYYERYRGRYDIFNDPEIKYNIAINHFNLGNLDKSEKILNDILKYYPYTLWENKSRIYISKIKNKS